MATLRATPIQDTASIFRGHAGTKSVGAHTAPTTWLIRAFHAFCTLEFTTTPDRHGQGDCKDRKFRLIDVRHAWRKGWHCRIQLDLAMLMLVLTDVVGKSVHQEFRVLRRHHDAGVDPSLGDSR